MRERAEQILRIVCMILAALVVYQLAGAFTRMNPLHGVTVPELPVLASNTNSPAGEARGTNLTAMSTICSAVRCRIVVALPSSLVPSP